MALDADALAALARFSSDPNSSGPTGDNKTHSDGGSNPASVEENPSHSLPQIEESKSSKTSFNTPLDSASRTNLSTGEGVEPGDRLDLENLIKTAIAEEADISREAISGTSLLREDLYLDTLSLYSVVAQIEASFKTKAQDRAIDSAQTVSDLIDLYRSAVES